LQLPTDILTSERRRSPAKLTCRCFSQQSLGYPLPAAAKLSGPDRLTLNPGQPTLKLTGYIAAKLVDILL